MACLDLPFRFRETVTWAMVRLLHFLTNLKNGFPRFLECKARALHLIFLWMTFPTGGPFSIRKGSRQTSNRPKWQTISAYPPAISTLFKSRCCLGATSTKPTAYLNLGAQSEMIYSHEKLGPVKSPWVRS